MNTLAEKWSKTGLLEDLYTDNQFNFISEKLEEVYNQIVNGSPDEKLASLIFPSMRRIYDYLNEDEMPTGKWLVDDCRNFLHKEKKLYDSLWENAINKIDGEMKFVSLYCEDVIKRLKK